MRWTILTRQLSHTGIPEVNTAADMPDFETRGSTRHLQALSKTSKNDVVYAIVEIHLFSDFFQA